MVNIAFGILFSILFSVLFGVAIFALIARLINGREPDTIEIINSTEGRFFIRQKDKYLGNDIDEDFWWSAYYARKYASYSTYESAKERFDAYMKNRYPINGEVVYSDNNKKGK